MSRRHGSGELHKDEIQCSGPHQRVLKKINATLERKTTIDFSFRLRNIDMGATNKSQGSKITALDVRVCFNRVLCFLFARRSCLVFFSLRAERAGRFAFAQGLDLRSLLSLGLGRHSPVGRGILLSRVVVFAGSCCRSRCRIAPHVRHCCVAVIRVLFSVRCVS